MIYLTAKIKSNGNHGHQLKDLVGAYTASKLFDIRYVHTYYEYLEFFAVGQGEPAADPRMKRLIIRGPYWEGISLRSAIELFGSIKSKFQGLDVLVSLEDNFRLFPCQATRDIFEQVNYNLSMKFAERHKGRKSSLDGKFYNVAVHISRGQDYNEEKHPEHFLSDWSPRFMFGLDYFRNIFEQIRSSLNGKEILFTVYTEKLHSEDIRKGLGEKDVKFAIGLNRNEITKTAVEDIFFDFVSADLLVSCNSSFSAMAALYRRDKPTIYHPHAHLFDLPSGHFLATNKEGMFDNDLLAKLVI